MSRARVALYSGRGGELAPDVSRVLSELGIEHGFVDERGIRSGKLEDYGLLIMSGGYTRRIIPALGDRGKRRVQDFVGGGRGYIGICAGVYVAPELGLTMAEMVREAGVFVTTIEITRISHPITDGYEGKVSIFYQNGPKIIPSLEDTVLAFYPDDRAAIIVSKYGRGRVVLFSPHPETLPETWNLLVNAINYVKTDVSSDS